MRPIISILIVNYNTPDLVYDCLKTIKKHVKGISYEVILVENGSAEGKRLSEDKIALALGSSKVAKLRSSKEKNGNSATQQLGTSFGHSPFNFRLLTLNSNLGFGGGNNAGAKLAKGKYLFFLNPDTLLVDDSVTRLLSFLGTHPKTGAVTPLLYQKDGKTLQEDFYGPFQSYSTLLFRHAFHIVETGTHARKAMRCNSDALYVDRISAAALMIKRDLFEKLKGFDDKIFMYMEDDDLCKRIVNLSYKNAVLSTAKIIHLEGQASTSKLKKKYYYKSQSYFWRKHHGLIPVIIIQLMRYPYKIAGLIDKKNALH